MRDEWQVLSEKWAVPCGCCHLPMKTGKWKYIALLQNVVKPWHIAALMKVISWMV